MKKIFALVIALALASTLSCGGSSSGGGGGGGSGDHYTQAQQITAGLIYAAIMSHMAGINGSLQDAIAAYMDSGATSGSLDFTYDYSDLFVDTHDVARIAGTDEYTISGSEEAYTFTIASSNPLNHTNTITSIEIPSSSSYAGVVIGSANGDVITGTASGSANLSGGGEGMGVHALSLTASNYDGTNITVTLPDETSGTGTFANWAPTTTLSGDNIVVGVSSVSSTVVYSGETYSCTGGTATMTVPAEGGGDPTFTVSTVPTCNCTNGC